LRVKALRLYSLSSVLSNPHAPPWRYPHLVMGVHGIRVKIKKGFWGYFG